MQEYRSRKDKIEVMFMRMWIKVRKFWRRRGKGFLLQLLGSLLVLTVAAGIGICLAFAKTEGSPEVYAKEYFRYFMTRNWEALYSMTDLEDSKYINAQTLGKMFTDLVPNGTQEYKFVDKGKQGKYQIIDIVYKEIGNEQEETLTLCMQKSGEKEYLVLPKWEVNLSENIIKDCKIHAPANVGVIFDGIDLQDCESEDLIETGMRTYKLGPVLAGNHQIELTAIETKPVTEIFELKDNAAEYTVQEAVYSLTDSAKKTYANQTMDMIIAMYTGVLTNAGCDNVKANFATDEEKAAVDAVYQNLLSQVNQDNGVTLVTMSFDSYNTEMIDYVYNQSFGMKFIFGTTFTAKGEHSIVGVRKTYDGTSQGEAIVRFTCRDGRWLPTGIEMNCFDYSKKEEIQA